MKNYNLNINGNTKIPLKFKKYFWDCRFDEIKWDTYSFFITERILQYGNIESVKWLLEIYSNDFLINVLKTSRNLDKKTVNYWNTIL